MEKNKKIYIIIAISLLVMIIAAFLFWFFGREKFSKSDVSFEIVAPTRAEAGEPQSFVFLYKNKSKKELENIKLSLWCPAGTLDSQTGLSPGASFNLENIAPGLERRREFRFSLFGLQGEIKEIKAKIEFIPKDYKESYALEAISKTMISSVPLFLKFTVPSQAASGQEIGFSFRYTSKSKYNFPKFAAKITYPPGFRFLNSNPVSSQGNDFWVIGDLKSKTEGEISIKGALSGIKEENKKFRTELGIIINNQFLPIYEETGITKILETFLSVRQFVNEQEEYAADPGKNLNFVIKYKNNTKEKLREVFITATLQCQRPHSEPVECLGWEKLKVENGEFDGFTKTIYWKAAGVQELHELYPGEEGEVKFLIMVKDDLPIKSSADINFVIESRVKIDMNPQFIPLSLAGFKIGNESVFITKVNSKLILAPKAYYNFSLIPNSGLIPPQVGKVTTYAIVWQITNLANDLKDVVVEASLPSNVEWKNNFLPANANIKYQPFTGKIIWEIGDLKAGTGIISPKKEIAFQVAFQPTKNLVGKFAPLVENITAQGKDSFTNKLLKTDQFLIGTDSPSDFKNKKQGLIAP